MNNLNQDKTLYIFATSDVPDVYINTIGHCVEHYSPIRKVILLSIVRDKGLLLKTDTYLKDVSNNIVRQLSLLQKGRYLYKDPATKKWKDDKEITAEDYDRQRYAIFAAQKIETRTVFYDSLDNEIVEFLKSSNGQCIFDVSAVSKALLIDIFVLLVEKGVTSIYVFELKRDRRTYDENELIHNLSSDKGDYEFVNLADSGYTRGKAIKTKEEAVKQSIAHENLDKAIELLAASYARWLLGVYLTLVLVSVASIVAIIIGGYWTVLEPWITFLFGMPLISYLIGIAVQIFFQKKFSLEPSNLYEWLRNHRYKQLSDEFKLQK